MNINTAPTSSARADLHLSNLQVVEMRTEYVKYPPETVSYWAAYAYELPLRTATGEPWPSELHASRSDGSTDWAFMVFSAAYTVITCWLLLQVDSVCEDINLCPEEYCRGL